MLGHDRKNHTKKKIETIFSTDLDVSDYGESESARKKKSIKKKTLRPLSGREKFSFLPYIFIITIIIGMCSLKIVRSFFTPYADSLYSFPPIMNPCSCSAGLYQS
jgi:hypothetical protein